MAKKRVTFEDDKPTGPVHRPKVKMSHTAQEVLGLDQPEVAAELTRHLRRPHKDAVLMKVRGAKRTFDGRIIR